VEDKLTSVISFVIPTSVDYDGRNNIKSMLEMDEEGHMGVRYSGSTKWALPGDKKETGHQKGN